jgi:hypothetical protein
MANGKRGGSEILKTIGAVLVIGGIVVATFLYGNRQRQEQVRRDREIRQQQEEQAARENNPQVAVNNTPDNTQVTPENQSAAPTNNAGVSPSTGAPLPATTPETGPEAWLVVPAGMIAGLWQVHRASKKSVRRALLRG